jgi:hypothetical protein
VLGRGSEVLSAHNSRRANAVYFDHETAIKSNLPSFIAITTLDLPKGQSVLLVIHESIHNKISNYSLLSYFQLREFRIIIDSISYRHGGTYKMIVKDNNCNDVITISLDFAGFMTDFRHRLPATGEISILKHHWLTQGYAPWSPSSFSD